MPSDTPLDAPNIDPAAWKVRVGEKVYGPFTLRQMKVFVAEGRVAAHTLVSQHEASSFRQAVEYGVFAEAISRAEAQKETALPSNYLIVTQIAETTSAPATSILNALGRFIEVAPGVFILRSKVRIGKVRALMDTICESRDRLIIVDASHNRLAWLGLGPETDIHIRAVWGVDLS